MKLGFRRLNPQRLGALVVLLHAGSVAAQTPAPDPAPAAPAVPETTPVAPPPDAPASVVNEPALAPPSTMPRSHACRRIASMPWAFQIACWLSVLPPEQTMPSTDRNTSSHERACCVLAMKLFWCDGSTLSGAQLRYQEMTPFCESALAVGK